MDSLRHRFPWLTDTEAAWLRSELLRRAASGFEQVQNWRDAADCWAELGESQRASELYARGGDLHQAAHALLHAGHYAAALDRYRTWETKLPETDLLNRIRALLGQAACHHLGSRQQPSDPDCTIQAAHAAYRQAYELIQTATNHHPLTAAAGWRALGDYGVWLHRSDLIQTGYEQALHHLPATARRDQLAIGRAYLAALRTLDDHLLHRQVEERLAEWGEEETVTETSTPPSYEELVARSQQIRLLHTLEEHTSRVCSVAFSPNGRLLASGSNDRTVRLWEVASGQVVRTLEGHTWLVNSIAFSPDGRLLASGSHDKTVRLWEVASGQAVRTLEGHTDWVISVAFSLDGRLLASGSADKTVRLWEPTSGQAVRTLEGHTDFIKSVAFSPDGRLLASGSNDKTVRLWDMAIALSGGMETVMALKVLEGHTTTVDAVAWSPNGSLLISRACNGSESNQLELEDGAVHFWHLASGRIVFTLPQLKAQNDTYWVTRALAISPDGRLLATYAPDSLKIIQLWDISALDVGPKP